MTQAFELEMVGGPWTKRLARRRTGFDELPWHEASQDVDPDQREDVRWVWTQSTFSEYASAAAFAEIATLLLKAGAPIDLVAAAGDFVVDEMLHAELSARLAMAFGGAVPLDVDLRKLVKPPAAGKALRGAAELIVRTSCVGEALTVPILKTTMAAATTPLVEQVVGRILHDESAHAELGGWFLDWADAELTDEDRVHLGDVASDAVAHFAPVLGARCEPQRDAMANGVLDCDTYDAAFEHALQTRVIAPLAVRGIVVSAC